MKTISKVILFGIIMSLCLTTLVYAAVPEKINYQGKLKESGALVTATKAMLFKIYDASTDGNQLWQSGDPAGTAANVSVTSGLFTYVLGGANDATDLSGIDWENETCYLEIIVAGTTLTPRELLVAVPYALSVRGLDIDATGQVGIGTTGPSALLSVGSTSQFQVNSAGHIAAIGGTASNNIGLELTGTLAGGGTLQSGINMGNLTVTSSATSQINGMYIGITTPNETFTTTNVYGLNIGGVAKGTSHTITNLAGIAVNLATLPANRSTLLLGTTTIPSGAFELYSAGTADSYFNGNVAIGTTNPSKLFQVVETDNTSAAIIEGTTVTSEGVLTLCTGSDTAYTGRALSIYVNSDANTTGNFIFLRTDENNNGQGQNPRWRVRLDGATFADGAYAGTGADYAEWFEREEDVPEGSLIGLNLVTGKARVWREGDPLIGVQSVNPGFVGNNVMGAESTEDEMRQNYVLVALIGQAEIKSENIVEEGRKVMTSDGQFIGWKLSNGKVFIK